MGSSKFNHVHVYLIGAVLLLIVGAGLFFGLIRPVNEENKTLTATIATTESTPVSVDNRNFTITQPPDQAKQALEELKVRYEGKRRELAVLERQKQLPPNQALDVGTGDPNYLLTRTLPRWIQLPKVVVDTMTRYAQTSARRFNVRVQTQFAAPAPSLDPNTVPRDIVAWTLGPMTVRGRFEDVMRWAENWNNAPLLVAVDGLRCSLADRNGVVEATATLSTFVFPTGEAAQALAAGGGGGAGAAGAPAAGGFGGPLGSPYAGAPGGVSPGGPPGGPPGGGPSTPNGP